MVWWGSAWCGGNQHGQHGVVRIEADDVLHVCGELQTVAFLIMNPDIWRRRQNVLSHDWHCADGVCCGLRCRVA